MGLLYCLLLTSIASLISVTVGDPSLFAATKLDETSQSTACACGAGRSSSLSLASQDTISSTDGEESTEITSINIVDGLQTNMSATDSLVNPESSATEEKFVPIKNHVRMVFIDGGTFYMGTNNPLISTDGEGPRRLVTLSDFLIDR